MVVSDTSAVGFPNTCTFATMSALDVVALNHQCVSLVKCLKICWKLYLFIIVKSLSQTVS